MKTRPVKGKPAKPPDDVEQFLAKSGAERDADVAQYKVPLSVGADGLPGEPLMPDMKKHWENSQVRRRGRQQIGRGAVKVMMSIERGLLEAADQMAADQGLKRSELVSAALRWALESVVTVVRSEDGTVLLVPGKKRI